MADRSPFRRNARRLPSQELHFAGNKSVKEETETAFKEIKDLEKKYNELTDRVSHTEDHESPDYLELLNVWHDAGHRLEILGIGRLEEQMERILVGLGFERSDFNRSVREFSGGWQMRIELANCCFSNPTFCCWMNRPITSTLKRSSGWKNSCRVMRAPCCLFRMTALSSTCYQPHH
jgi:ATPase subunit of ABC transporter with duplicated ATPase domains